MFCPNCGTQLPDGSVFCSNCGAKLAAPQQAPQQPQYRPQRPVGNGMGNNNQQKVQLIEFALAGLGLLAIICYLAGGLKASYSGMSESITFMGYFKEERVALLGTIGLLALIEYTAFAVLGALNILPKKICGILMPLGLVVGFIIALLALFAAKQDAYGGISIGLNFGGWICILSIVASLAGMSYKRMLTKTIY